MPRPETTVRVFVSSTFRDMHAERDHLVTVVFPELRGRLERLGLELYDVDLRWGVPETGVDGERANSWAYCKQWIDRVEPFFVALLGQRYGWVPPATDLHDPEDQAAYAGMSITEMEIRHAVLSGKLRRTSLFYLRATQVPPSTPEQVYREFVDAGEALRLEQLAQAIRATCRPVRSYECRWTGQRFEHLEAFGRLVLDDLWSGVLRDARYVPREAWRQALGHDPDGDPLYTDAQQPVPPALAERVLAAARPAPTDPWDVEAAQMAAFAAGRMRWFHGRAEELERLQHFVQRDLGRTDSGVCLVVGVAGQGKSALLARLAGSLAEQGHPVAGSESGLVPTRTCHVIPHFVGATEQSADTRSLLERLLHELDRSGVEWPSEDDAGRDLRSLSRRLTARLKGYDGDRRLVLVLDGINQLSDGHDLSWLPEDLGFGVRVILSCQAVPAGDRTSPEGRVLSALRARRPPPEVLELRRLGDGDVREIVAAYLREHCKELDREHIDTICRMEQGHNPLYLLVMLSELRTLGGNDLNRKVPQLVAEMGQKYPDSVRLFGWVLERLEVFGPEAVRQWCTYLALGRVGLSSRELRELLAPRLGAEAAEMALRIERSIRRYLQRRGAQLDFFHGQLRQAVERRYLPADRTAAHAEIAAYLETRWRQPDAHALRELPHHQVEGRQWPELQRTLCDLHFVEARCVAGTTHELVRDYAAALAAWPELQGRAQEQRRQAEQVASYGWRLVEYAQTWSEARERHAADPTRHPLPSHEAIPVPEPPDSAAAQAEMNQTEAAQAAGSDPWASETAAGRVQAFATFVSTHAHLLAQAPQETIPIAWNQAAVGTVTALAGPLAALLDRPWVARDPRPALPPPLPACLRTLDGHTDEVVAVAMPPDGRIAVSAGEDGTLRVWDLADGSCLRAFQDWHAEGIKSLALAPDGRTLVSAGERLYVWDLDAGLCLRELEYRNTVWSVALTADGRRAISASEGGGLHLWDVPTGQCRAVLLGHNDGVVGVAMAADGRTAVSVGRDETLRVWDLTTGQCVRILKGYPPLALTPDGRTAIAGAILGGGNHLQIWDLASGRCLHSLEGHTDRATSVAVTPDGRTVVSAGGDRTLRVWDVADGRCLRTLRGHTARVTSVVVTADGRTVVSASEDRTLRVWDMAGGQCLPHPEGHTDWVASVAVPPDGRTVISASHDHTLRIWDLASGQCRHILQGHRGSVYVVAVTPDGSTAVSTGQDNSTLRVWDLAGGRYLRDLEGYVAGFAFVVRPPRARPRRAGDPAECLCIWDPASAARWRGPEGETAWVWFLVATPDGRTNFSCNNDRILEVRDLAGYECLRTLEGHTGKVHSLAVTPDGRTAVSASEDRTLRVWDLASGRCLHILEGHSGRIWSVAVTADGRSAVSGGQDQTLRLWDLAGGQCLAQYPLPAPVGAVSAISPGGRFVAGLADGQLHFLTLRHLAFSIPFVTGSALPKDAAPNSEQPPSLHLPSEAWNDPAADLTATCPWCGQRFVPARVIKETIAAVQKEAGLKPEQAPCLHLPSEAWNEPRLHSDCPCCRQPLRFNPFLVVGSR